MEERACSQNVSTAQAVSRLIQADSQENQNDTLYIILLLHCLATPSFDTILLTADSIIPEQDPPRSISHFTRETRLDSCFLYTEKAMIGLWPLAVFSKVRREVWPRPFVVILVEQERIAYQLLPSSCE